MNLTITHIDTACILLDINGFRILTDPTLDKAGHRYHHGFGAVSRKTDDPALPPVDLQQVDLILLSHHQHKDNLDTRGKELLDRSKAPILSTQKAARELPRVTGLANWQSIEIDTPRVKGLRITATPAQHHPWWIPEFISGPVIGFVIEYDEQRNGVIYISGDTVYFNGIDEVARRYNIDVAILHAGGVQFRYLTGFGIYTMNSKHLLQTIKALNPNKIIPIHYRGWSHFKEKEATLRQTIHGSAYISDKTIFLQSGEPFVIPVN
ncbi:MBL fold metallo-hydrolase [Paraflavitalea sp. CAU 1676]|uniref:MBL fold metallo-hydrolase n=1 Tax=Paraflavitalea sp. CAU 1676 TaxID=3032598 RepID=UPI0023DC20E8|nr:MBL fold metallo-hydrolase [Paraflavitalea sp. CAU 1676]MDF2187860.1 MBL fold metallo-hydrolase [Paraflavitalea sp. CAU 1676]